MKDLLAVAAGGAVGASARYAVYLLVGNTVGTSFPWATLIVNILGAFALGTLVEVMALAWSVSSWQRAFMVVGVLGGFTTFSTFTLDVAVLWERDRMLAATSYVTASFVLTVLACFGAMSLWRRLLN